MNDEALLESCIPHPNRNVELGGISFTAIHANTKIGIITETANKMNRPILLVVQQTTGPRFAREFGANVLSHPLVIEAAEDLFVPVALIRGRRSGSDDADSVAKVNGTKTLSDFDDLTYNAPLVRILNSVGEDLVPPIVDSRCTIGNITSAMTQALESHNKDMEYPYPRYLKHVMISERAHELNAVSQIFFGTSCFWVGEAELGAGHGVLATQNAWLGGREIVIVSYDNKITSYQELVRFAIAKDVVEIIYYCSDTEKNVATRQVELKMATCEVARLTGSVGGSVQLEHDTKNFIARTVFRYVPLTKYQSSRINSALFHHKEEEGVALLSPRQSAIFRSICSNPEKEREEVIDSPIHAAW
eukprot:CAMPEP_0196816070 /NCGR_PEP_ID=MMETSP1362-20130617/53397_1 /TAXON_ID=163516 /ORGANISM="Leptocylindrus danicus, Strain CCMP1856" /LENGTH=359 /DNA_ID=CAMNT_0042193273 /DNA_START=109 /DNA_END=1185 /DNA_ORIENTATION=+